MELKGYKKLNGGSEVGWENYHNWELAGCPVVKYDFLHWASKHWKRLFGNYCHTIKGKKQVARYINAVNFPVWRYQEEQAKHHFSTFKIIIHVQSAGVYRRLMITDKKGADVFTGQWYRTTKESFHSVHKVKGYINAVKKLYEIEELLQMVDVKEAEHKLKLFFI